MLGEEIVGHFFLQRQAGHCCDIACLQK